MPDDTVILRDRDGRPQHAVVAWERFEALTRAASADAAPSAAAAAAIARAARRLGGEVALAVPDDVLAREAGGAHPVRAWRESRKLSQVQLSTMVGISRAYLTQIETGERTGTIEVTARLARALGCLIEDLIPVHADPLASALATLAAMPLRLHEIVEVVPHARRTARPAAGGFSLVEHACHLRDVETEGYATRLARMLAEDNPALVGIDGQQLARERDYQQQGIEDAAASFAATRSATVARLRQLSAAQRSRTGTMGDHTMTIDDMVAAMVAHDSEHMDELGTLRDQLGARK
jgi:transcriptional regulator with XRE-family HTH domain